MKLEEGYLIKNPCVSKRIVIPGEDTLNKEVEHFTDDELNILLSFLDNNMINVTKSLSKVYIVDMDTHVIPKRKN